MKNYLQKRSRLLLLIGVMVVVSLLIVSTAIYFLYIAAFEVTRERLVDTVKSQSRMMEAVAGFDAIYSTDYPGGSKAATLSQIIDASEHFEGLGKTGEFTLAERAGDDILFLLRYRHQSLEQRNRISFSSKLAQPMRLALQGKSGSIIGLDYRGEQVLAAYEPVSQLDYGIVAKMDLSEVRAPFIRAGYITFGVMLVLVTLGVLFFYRITNPIFIELQRKKDSLNNNIRILRESEEKLRQFEHIVSNSTDMMALLNKKYCYLTANNTYLQAFIKKPEELIGSTMADVFGKKFFEEVIKPNADRCLKGEVVNYQEWVEFPAFAPKYMDTTYSPYTDADNNILGLVVITRDITQRKHNEEALKESTVRLEESQRVANLGSYVIDISTGIWTSSDVLDEIFGIEKDFKKDINGWAEIVHPDEREEMLNYLTNHVFAERQPFNKEYRIIRLNDQNERWVHGLGKLEFDRSGELISMIGTIQDITNRKKAEENLRQSRDRLRELSSRLEFIREQERTEIARDIHDDLGQSLTALKLDISSIKSKTEDEDLINKAESMSALVDSTIKTVQKVAARLRPGILDDLGLISAMEWQLEEFQNRSGIKCEFKCDNEDMELDRELSTTLFRIFQELLTNIARHAKASKVNVQLSIKDDILTFKVNDNGIGIDEKAKNDSKSYGIMGISERLIPWNGKFEITGKKGKGTIATVTLPLNSKNNK